MSWPVSAAPHEGVNAAETTSPPFPVSIPKNKGISALPHEQRDLTGGHGVVMFL